MKIEQIYTACLSQGSYYISSENEAIIIDPLRETQQYIDKANKDKAQIKYVFETHFHADFVSGHIDLARKTGAKIVYGPNANTDYPVYNAKDSEIFSVGKISIKVLHTPGHTPESTCYLLTDENGKNNAIFTGDTLFIGDVGRPDLATSSNITSEDLAGILFDSLRNKIMPLDDDIIVYPAHGAGSSCGKNLSKETFSTLGVQKKTNYALRENMTKKEFVKELLDGMPIPPKYFKDNAMMNKLGYNSFDDIIKQGNKSLGIEEFKNFLLNPEIILLDVRHQKDFMNKHIPNSIFIGLNGSFAPWVGSIIEDTNKKILLITPEGREVETLTRLSRVGFDNCLGFLNGGINEWENQGNPIASIETIKSKDFVDILKLNKINILDVRSESEFDNKHIEGAINFPLNSLQEMYNEIKYEDKLYVHCAGGYRSVIAISILMKLGFKAMTNITKGFNEILKCNLNENCYNSINSLNCNNT
tara:strand:- start:2027 stop:3448 length:1422 start_codon:yes stop_codon:yes gene_type:complete